jgi:PPOX class probable F420-dependent enzyme
VFRVFMPSSISPPSRYREPVAAIPGQLTADARQFLRERHLATFTSLRRDGTPHVTPVGFTWDEERSLARVICSGSSLKARNAARGGPLVLCQLEGRRWLSLEGTGEVSADPERVADAVARYAQRYRQPRENPRRVAIEVRVTRVLGSATFFGQHLWV